MQAKRQLFLVLTCATLVACSDELNGTYADDPGVTQYVFAGNGDVKISVLGSEVDAEYRLDGDKVLVTSAQGTVVLTRRDERLFGPMGLALSRLDN